MIIVRLATARRLNPINSRVFRPKIVTMIHERAQVIAKVASAQHEKSWTPIASSLRISLTLPLMIKAKGRVAVAEKVIRAKLIKFALM